MSRAAPAAGQAAELPPLIVDMSADDQQRINHFTRLHQHYSNLRLTIDALEKRLTRLEDAEDETATADDTEDVYTVCGTGFIPVAFDSAEEFLAKIREQAEAQIAEFKAEAAEIRTHLARLRADLLGRHGGAIKLEFE